jgi:hypothetical protein
MKMAPSNSDYSQSTGVANVYRRRTQVDEQAVFVEVHPVPISGYGRANLCCICLF